MPQYEVALPNGKKYRVNSPDPLSQDQVWQAVQGQIGPVAPEALQSTAELESAESAPMSFGDTFKSLSSGVVGGGKSIVDFFGAGTDISKGLGEAQSFLQQSLTPERKAEIARREELQNRAAQSGSMLQEAKAFLGGVAEAPLQSLAQAAGSSVPAIAVGILALPVEAPAAIALGVGTIAKLTVGAIQGVGEYKGSVFDAVKAEYMKQGKSEQEAEALAIKSQEYSRDKAFEIGGSALLGALDAVSGAEPGVAKALRKAAPTGVLTKEAIEKGVAALPDKAVSSPSYLGQFVKGVAAEAPLEGSQGAFGQYGQNVALQQAGADVTPMQGVLGAGLRDAAVGALFGGAASPLGMKPARQEYETDQFLRQAKEDIELDKRAAELEKTQSQVKEAFGDKQLLLPAPAKAYEEPKDPLQDPVGRVTEDELGKAIGDNTVVNYLNKYRRENSLPKLKSYSIEDIKDAMTAQNPEGEEGALNSILAYKTGYKDETYAPEDINNVAVAKNVATETKGFSDFLTRATGKSDLNTMTQPELHSVAKALEALPRTGKEEQLVLPEGSNASRFTQDQYNQGVTTALMGVKQGKPVSLDQARNAVKTQTDLKTDRDADHMLRTAASNEDLIIERGTGYQATNKAGDVLGTYGTEAEAKRNHRRADITPVETQLVRAPEEVKTEKATQLPEGYGIEKTAEVGEERPAAYVLREEGSTKNASQTFAEEVDVKRHQDLLVRKREANAAAKDAEADRIRKQLETQQASIAQMEADGLTGTPEHTKALNAFKAANVSKSDQITKLLDEAESLRAPLKIVPIGKKSTKVEKHTVIKGGKKLGTFPNKTEAEKSILTQATDEELQTIADRGGAFGKRAEVELGERKRTTPGIKVKGTTEGLEAAGVRTPEIEAKLKELEAKLIPLLKKFGLEQVGLNVVRAINNNAEGAFKGSDKLIQVAFDATNPIKTMRHEALHALKELGFFTPQQWKALEKQAKDKWIGQYLENVKFDANTSRLQAYRNLGLSEEDIIEEAIADAFGDFEAAGKAPPGMLDALFKRLQQFFRALRQALTGAGFESAEDIFGKIERGELKAGKQAETEGDDKFALKTVQDVIDDGIRRLVESARKYNVKDLQDRMGVGLARADTSFTKIEDGIEKRLAALGVSTNPQDDNNAFGVVFNKVRPAVNEQLRKDAEERNKAAVAKFKLSLRQGIPVSTVPIMEADDTEARAELGLNTKAVRNRFNSVRDIAIALNKATKDAFGQMDQNNLTAEDMDRIAKAIADEVGYQLSTTSETGTGTGWYSSNYPNAVKRLAKRFPELETNPTARAVFSAVVAVSSNGERVATNIKNAIKMYERIRQGKKMIAVGSRRATALENNLIMIQDLLDEHGDNFEQELLKTTTVKDMNAALRAKGEKADTSYLADTTVPAAAIYFGPKLGAFFANLSGAEGYLTMDLWWSRTINRMRGLLIPKATDASINTFREMMDIPSASREEVVAATIPLAAKYKEYGFNTELEHLMKSKEPKEKVNKPKWFAKAEKVVGDAYEQLLYEHKLEKIANTIHKNEFEMLEEAPFTGTDRKFMYDAARKAQSILRSRGVNLTLADVQAALWYYEKRLYQKLSGRKADDIGYEEAINSQAAQSIGRARPSVVFGGKPDSGTVAGGEITGSEELRGILADSTSDERKYSLRSGVIVEVAPNPDQEVANKWREMTPDERLNTTKAVASKAVNRVLDELNFKGYTSYFSSGKYEGEVNPNIIIEAPDDASAEDLRELASVLGYVLDQKAMVAFDENNKSSGDQNTFIKVVPPSDMGEADLERLRKHIAESVPQADGDTLRDDALLFGNFSAYNDNVETLSDKQYHQAILDAIESFDYDGTIRVSEPETFHSEMIWPESRSDYLKGTRYGKSGEVQGREGPDVRGSGISRLQTISDEAIALRDRWIDSRGSARRGGGGERSKVDIGQPTAEYGKKRENAESVIGVHFSQQPRAVLSSYFHGNGIRGLEKERLSDPANKDIRDRVYFYADTGKGVFPEESVGGVQHVIRLNNLYDIQKDPLKIVKTNTGVDAADRASKLERKILKAGYDGYVTRDPIQNQGFAVLVGDHSIETNVGKYSLKTYFPTAEEAENAAYKKAPPVTAEFKRFFGGSTVKEEGRAQPMFHASMEDFSIFRENRPIFVSPDASFAEEFIKRRIRESGSLSYLSEGQVKKKTAKIYPLWVRAETPFDFDNEEHVQQIVGYLQANNQATGNRIAMGGGLGLVKAEDLAQDLSSGRWTVVENSKTQEALKALGFDSFYTLEGGAKNLAVFKANQVKSITGNLGSFDESGDIRYSLKPVSADIDAAIDRTTTARDDKGFIGRILEAIFPQSAGHFRQQALNRYNQLGVYDRMLADKMGGAAMLADQSAESAALMSDLSASVTASAFGYGNRTGGVPVYKNGITTIDTSVKGPIAILAPLAKYNNPRIYQRYQYWAGVKRGKRFMADGKEKNFEQADIARAAQLEKDHPEFVQIQKEMNEFNNGLVKYMVQTGVIKPELAKAYMEHADYIPFYRQMDGEKTVGPNIFQSISGVKPPKALKGGEAPLADYLETIVRNTQSAIQSGMKNVAAQRAVNVAMQLGPKVGAQRLNTQESGFDVVQVLEKGERVSYRVADTLFIDACRSLNLPDLPFMGILAAPANALRNLVTKDPGFMLANLMRDSLSSWVTSGTSVKPIIGTVAGFTKALSGKSASMEALLNAGILGGYEFSSGVLKSGEVLEADLNKKYGKATGAKVLLKPFTSLWDALEKGTEASDAATRIAIYERVLADTGNEAEAIFRSLEVMNFNRKGSSAVIRIATAAIPFLNARMQGLDIFYRASFGRDTVADPAAKQKAFFVRGATLMALSIAMYIMVSDDDEYKKQEEETKDNYWIVPGVGKFPTPFEVGFLFKTVPERIYAYMFKDDTGEDLKESMKRGIISTLAFNPIPQTFKPILEAAWNYNSFTGRAIVGAGMEGRSPEFQVGPSTSEVAEKLGGAMGLSPLKIDHILQGYTGTIGMYAVQLIDSILNVNNNSPRAAKRFEQLPIIKRFALDPEARGNITQFYALKNATEQAVTTANFLERAGDSEAFVKYVEENAGLLANKDYVQSIEKEMKTLREARSIVQSAEMTAEEKRDLLVDIGRAENALTENTKEVKKIFKGQ